MDVISPDVLNKSFTGQVWFNFKTRMTGGIS
jgi:hypothetical protein